MIHVVIESYSDHNGPGYEWSLYRDSTKLDSGVTDTSEESWRIASQRKREYERGPD
jgi:hypothetical protein